MPAKSKAQFALMKGICEGTYPSGYRGISKKVACEFVNHQSPKGLPKKVKKKKKPLITKKKILRKYKKKSRGK